MKKPLKIVAFIVVLLVSLPLELELLLSVTDIWGLKYFDDLATLWEKSIIDPTRGYILPPGTYRFSHWTATELENSVRWLPNNAKGPCEVVFLGDSVTWGHGVNDAETWVNLIAAQMPQINAINPSLDGYNSENVRRAIAGFPEANVIVYLIVGNDTDSTYGYSNPLPYQPHLSMIEKYIRYYAIQKSGSTSALEYANVAPATTDSNVQRFISDLKALKEDKRVVFIAFDKEFDNLKQQFGIRSIPAYTHRISFADPHPNAEGSKEMAASIQPIVQQAVAQQCPRV
jgi:lysophospholipase L1-like esterase